MRYLLKISYDGENYSGWQRQKKVPSVEGEIERALKVLLKEDVNLVGSGRTDAKVSALCQMAHFDYQKKIENLNKFIYSMNGILNNDIKILQIKPSKLHARFDAKSKTYLYKMYKSDFELPLKFKSLRIDTNINLDLMKEASKLLIGKHDFKNFCASNSEVESTIREIYSIKFKKSKEDIEFYISGNGFLYKMVRNIVGLLLELGKGKLSLDQFKDRAFGDCLLKKTAPATPLVLYEVKYK